MKVLLCILSVVGISLGDSSFMNTVVDLLLEGMNEKLAQSNNSIIHVNKLCTELAYYYPANINCYAGTIKDLASLKRNGDVSLTQHGSNTIIKITMSLVNLEMHFNYCHLTIAPIVSFGDEVKASVSSNSIEAQLTVTNEGEECKGRLDSISVTALGEIGFATNNWLGSEVLTVLARAFHYRLVNDINQVLQEVTVGIHEDVNFCDEVPH